MKNAAIIGLIIFLLAVPGVVASLFYFRSRKDTFDITTDPVRPEQNYEQIPVKISNYVAKRNGLNRESDNNITVCDFIKKFESNTTFLENVNQNPCSVVARQICSVLYSDHNEYFTNRWSGLGECEVEQTRECAKCPNKLKIRKESSYYPTTKNL